MSLGLGLWCVLLAGAPKIVVVTAGEKARSAYEVVERAVGSSAEVVPEGAMESVLSSRGITLVPTNEGALLDALGRLATALDAVAAVHVNLEQHGSEAPKATVVWASQNGDKLHRQTVTVGRVKKKKRKKTVSWELSALSGAVRAGLREVNRQSAVPTTSEPDVVREPVVAATEEPDEKPSAGDEPLFVPKLLVGGGGRNFAYGGLKRAGPRTVSLPPSPRLGLEVAAFPFGDIGVVASYARVLGASSKFVGDTSELVVAHPFSEWRVDLEWRDLWQAGPLGLDAWAGYGALSFGFDMPANDPRALEVPAVDYRFVRLGGIVNLEVGDVLARLRLGLRYALDGGQVTERFMPDGMVVGADTGLSLSYDLEFMTAEVGGAFVPIRYLGSGGANVADSAKDDFFELWAAASMSFGG